MPPSPPYVSAPSSKRMPPRTHTPRASPPSPPVWRSTAPGTTKIPEPMTVPTTMKIRSRKRSVRVSEAPGTAASWPNGEANLSRSNRHAAAGVERGSPAPVSPSSEDHMSRRPYLVPAFLAIAARLVAQSAADARWLAECRDPDDGWRVRHCEVRVSSVKASGDAITVDPGKNGGGAVRGCDSDSGGGDALIQTEARSEDEAAGLGRRIRTRTSRTPN